MDRRPLRRTLLLATIFPAAILTPTALNQTPSPSIQTTPIRPLSFEIVAIRPDPASTLGHDQVTVTPNGWRMTHSTLMSALLTAYVPTTSDAMMYTVSTLTGIPDWMKTELYNIDAKVAEQDLAAWQDPTRQPAMLRAMMQTMLADRCQLIVHRGSKDLGVYLLVVGKNGPRLKPTVPADPHPGAVPLPGGGEFLPNDGTGNAAFYAAPIRALTVVLSNFAGRPVEDKTGLTGRYDITFRRPRPGGPSIDPDPSPTIFDVVQDLGLKLEPSKTSVETLVLDHIEKPSAN